jgi:4-diphosphocytidyl-2-C-methyl-D-erythritol kinase
VSTPVAGIANDPARRLSPVVRLAPAKLNLTLAVIGRRRDGYHDLHSVVVPLELADRLSLAIQPVGGDSITSTGFDPGSPERNLVLRAIDLTRAAVARSWPGAPMPPPALAVRLEKRIPVAAGLGGGSSDAAAAIDGALEVWGADLSPDERAAMALEVGSDVPLFLAGGAALMEGRGERVTPLHGVHASAGGEAAVLLVTPALSIHTADVFGAWSGGAMGEPGVARRSSEHFASEFGSGLSVGRLVERAAVLAASNDLLPATLGLRPGLVPFRRALARTLSRPIGMSGSGPTLWALYASFAAAQRAAEQVDDAVDSGAIVPPGDGRPFVAATTIVGSTSGAVEAPLEAPVEVERRTSG